MVVKIMPSYPTPRTPAGSPSHRANGERRHIVPPAGNPSAGRWFADHAILLCLFGILLLALLAEMPWLTRPIRTHLLQAAVVLVYTLIVGAGPVARLTLAALRGPTLWLLGLLAWCVLSAVLAPYPAFAVAEMLRLALGAGVYFTAAYVLRPHETRFLPYLLLGLGAAVGVYGLVEFGADGNFSTGVIHSIFGNHEQLGSFLILLLPFGLALALDRAQTSQKRLLFAQGAALLIGAAVLLARTRSAWFGAAAGLLFLTFLTLRYSTARLNRTNKALIVGPTLILLLAFAGLLAFGELTPLVSHRAATLAHAGDDTSLTDRLHRWRAACRMASERPVTGWGLGAWPVMEGRWTHQGDDVSEVLANGTGHSNLAHNFWVQWAAETGGVGLALHFGALAAFLLAGLRGLLALDRERRTLLLGCLAVAVSGAVDMIGAPSYTFPGVSSLFWVALGLGVGLLREEDALPPSRLADWLVPAAAGLFAACTVLGIGNKLRADGANVPRGTLTVTAQPSGPVAPGTRVLWTATYHAPDGTPRPTAPGTVWTTTAGRLNKTSPTFIFANKAPERSGWQGSIPADVSQVTVQASYWDGFSRRYDLSRTVVVRSLHRDH